jgi:hypothetical protein
MSKIFRLHSGAADTIEHWHQINGHLSDAFINSIDDPAGSNIETQITSIPSPFARMDLIRTSFRFVNTKNKLEGDTIYHRMVSECFDIAEIIFNIEAFKDNIEILEWNSGVYLNAGKLDIEAQSDLGKLLSSQNQKHRLLGETLKMFLFQDATAFNFQKLKHIYLLNYINGPELINIIGGTSPATIFFSSANDLSFVDITFGNDRMFDLKLCALKDRSKEFIKYIYAMRLAYSRFSNTGFSEDFPDIDNYLNLTFEQLDAATRESIRKFDENTYESTYVKINVKSEGNNAEILGLKLLAKNYGIEHEISDNAFLIANTKNYEGRIPCALPIEAFNEELNYAGGKWLKNYHENVPYVDEKPLDSRTLPNQNQIIYPYLTISDLLEAYIIKLPFPIDSVNFFDGHYELKKGEKDHGYVLPIKKLFFELFSVQDLQGVVADGKKMFEINQMASGVKVTLRIPILNNRYIQYSRIYNTNQLQDRIQQSDEKHNIGVIIENQVTIAIYPFIKMPRDLNPHYRVLCVDRDVALNTKHLKYTLNFFKDSTPKKSISKPTEKNRSNKSQSHGVTTNYSIVEENFDFIEISHNNATGILIPKFTPLPQPAHSFKFAVDFGTTNTHIEYKSTIQDTTPFDILEKDIQYATLHEAGEKTERSFENPKYDFAIGRLTQIIDEEFIPRIIGKNVQHKFPQRTVINDNGTFNADESSFALGDFNIPFWYIKEDYKLNSEITSNLKWSDFKTNKKLERRTNGFLEQLMLMMRNKVLRNNGDISQTEIVWFYPSSMPSFRRKFLKEAWESLYKKYFNGASKLGCMSESLAPFYYFKNKAGVTASAHPVASIDIGGGTSDAVVYVNNEPSLLTSFRFASNSLFGDGYGNTSSNNGFVLRFEKEIRDSLSSTSANKLMEIYDAIKSKSSKSLELIEFFFSLEENKIIKDNKLPISFSKLLSDDTDLKIVFLLYYGAIIYHLAKLMKVKNYEVPRFVTFSGNGAKIIKIITGGSDFSDLGKFTQVIFKDVYNIELPYVIDLKLEDNPKEITCKGGLECNNYFEIGNIEQTIKNVLIGTTDNLVIPSTSLYYSKIKNDAIINSVLSETNSFIDKFFEWNVKINYYNTFGINPGSFEKYKTYLKEDIKSYLIDGIDEKLKEAHDNINVDIEETLFFYPLNGCLNKLAYKIYLDTNK